MRGVKKDNQLPLDQHREIGQKLYEMRAYLTSLSVTVANTYSQGEQQKILTRLGHATNALDELRHQLDNQLFKEYPHEEDLKGIYYNTNK